jgi:hypothetical protein
MKRKTCSKLGSCGVKEGEELGYAFFVRPFLNFQAMADNAIIPTSGGSATLVCGAPSRFLPIWLRLPQATERLGSRSNHWAALLGIRTSTGAVECEPFGEPCARRRSHLGRLAGASPQSPT